MATGELKAILTTLGRYNNENTKIKVNKVTKELLNIAGVRKRRNHYKKQTKHKIIFLTTNDKCATT